MNILALVLTLTAHASPVAFRADSKLPLELQAKVAAAVQARCTPALFQIQEDETILTPQTIDQGQTDLYFRTFLKATYLFDGTHPVGADLEVRSARYAISNPAVERDEVIGVKAFSEGLCR